jgi:hypothetical protein
MVVLLRDRKSLQYDVIGLKHGERFFLIGIVIVGMSALAFAAGLFVVGLAIVGAGAVIALIGVIWHRAKA